MSRLFFVLACLAMFTTAHQASVCIPSAQVYLADGPIAPPDGDPPADCGGAGAFQA